MQIESPFHEGERLVQERAGEQGQAARNAGVIADSIVPGALGFIAQQRLAIVGSVAPDGALWASLLMGDAGFVQAPDVRSLVFDVERMLSAPEDPLWANLEDDERVGMLFIELATRRRLRVNGNMSRGADGGLRLDVVEAYPNCPQYIQRRDMEAMETHEGDWDTQSGGVLTASQKEMVAQADTLFVASAHPDGGVDASHRGGNPGFLRWVDEATLRVPDYHGNSMFNTLGNLNANPKSGLLFVDFEGGRTLQLTGRAEIRWDLDVSDHPTGGTGRYWDFSVDEWVETTAPHHLEWTLVDRSTFNP